MLMVICSNIFGVLSNTFCQNYTLTNTCLSQCRCHAGSFMSITHRHCYFFSLVQIYSFSLLYSKLLSQYSNLLVFLFLQRSDFLPSVMQDVFIYLRAIQFFIHITSHWIGFIFDFMKQLQDVYFSCLFTACTAKHVRMNLFEKKWML